MPEPSSWSATANVCLVLRWLLVGAASGCEQDVVQPGFYAEPDAGPARTISASPATDLLGAMAAPAPATATLLAGTGSTGAPSGSAVSMEVARAGTGATPDPACDMTGRWIVTHHDVVDGLGQLQTAHSWKYFEIEQQGAQLLIKRGLHCGDDVVANTLLAANADLHSAWPGTLANNDYRAMSASSRATADGCEISFAKFYTVAGATAAYYRDPGHPLPTLDQKASTTAPGWEDWDGDGHPGVSMVISGALAGTLYAVTRVWHQLTAQVHDTTASIRFVDNWNQEEALLGYDGSELLTQQGVRAADMSLHFAEAARLGPTEAQGDDTTVCAAVRKLASTLTPNASQN